MEEHPKMTPRNALKGLMGLTYGVRLDDGTLVSVMDDDFDERSTGANLVVQTPAELLAAGTGMCHDVSGAIHARLKAAGIPHRAVMVQGDYHPDYPTHSFVVARDGDTYSVLDPLTYRKDGGTFGHASYRDAIASRISDWKKEGEKGNIRRYDIPESDWNSRDLLDFLHYRHPEQDKTAAEYAKGIPDRKIMSDPGRLPTDTLLTLVRQRHDARRAGLHEDLRIGDRGGLESWAVPKFLPEGDESRLAVLQPRHAWGYKDFAGTIGPGYGRGTVEKLEESPVIVVKNSPGHLAFTRGDRKGAPLYDMVRTHGTSWLVRKRPQRAPDDVSGYMKEHFRSVDIPTALKLIAAGASASPKVDGAGALLHLGRHGATAWGIRDGKSGKPEYTDYIGGLRSLEIPKDLRGVTLRAELFGTRAGRSIPVGELSGLLNSSLAKAVRKREGDGIRLLLAALAVHRDGTDDYDPKAVRDIADRLGSDRVVTLARRTGGDAASMVREIGSGGSRLTDEGVVLHLPGSRPVKAKFRDDAEVTVDGVFPGRAEGRAGGFTYRLPGGGTGRVGSGFSHALLRDMLAHPDRYRGRTARITAQERYPSGAYRGPVFNGFKED